MATKNIVKEKVRENENLGNLKNLGILGLVVVGIVLMLSGSVNAYNISGNVCTCNACDDCENALNDDSCTTVKLNTDITNHTGTCINNPQNFTNKTFDCQGHTIDGNGEIGSVGIYLDGKSGNTIKNCVIINFFDGILLVSSSNNLLIDNTVKNTENVGINLHSSSNNILTNNTVTNIFLPGIDSPSQLFFISGIALHNSSNNILTNNTVNNHYYGIVLVSSSNNILTNNTVNNNTQYGLYLKYSSNNIINSNHFCSNLQKDIYNIGTNTGDNNTCNTTYEWNDTGATGCTYDCSTCFCSSCDECNNKLNDISCTKVKLTANITNYAGTCINNPQNFNNKVFDCQGHTIDGDDSGTENNPTYGILLGGKSNNTIKNCAITNFYHGIYLYSSSSNNTLTNNTANNNDYDGIYLGFSSNYNTLTNNTANNNGHCNDGEGCYGDGICLFSFSNYNTLTNNTANNNLKGIWFHSSSNNTLINNTANNNGYGILLSSSSSNNTITGNTANNNNYYGIWLYSSSSNILNANHFCSNSEEDIYNYDGTDTGNNNTCDTIYNWNDNGTTGCTYDCSTCFCSSCDECNNKLNDPNCKTVKVIANITSSLKICINFSASNKTFDCQGNFIDGNGTASQGIRLANNEKNTIRNCELRNFVGAVINLNENSSHNLITGNTIIVTMDGDFGG